MNHLQIYTGNDYNVSSFNSVFGVRKTLSNDDITESLYYFYDFDTAATLQKKQVMLVMVRMIAIVS